MLVALPRIRIRFYQLPVVRSYFETFDRSLGERGVKKTFAIIARRMNVGVDVHMSPATKSVLQNEGVLLVSNHPSSFFDPVPITQSIPERSDMKVIGTDNLLSVGPNLSEITIPVYIRHKHRRESKSIYSKPGLFVTHDNSVTEETKKKLNRLSLEKSRESLESGELVLLFPEGTRHGGSWFSGIGHIISRVEKRQTKIVFVNLQKVSAFDVCRLFYASRRRKVLPVHFSEPLSVGDVLDITSDPKQVRDHLEQRYHSWESSITNTR